MNIRVPLSFEDLEAVEHGISALIDSGMVIHNDKMETLASLAGIVEYAKEVLADAEEARAMGFHLINEDEV